MRRLIRVLTLSALLLSLLQIKAQCEDGLVVRPKPFVGPVQDQTEGLTEEDKRQILQNLYEVEQLRLKVAQLEAFIAKDAAQDQREREQDARDLAISKRELAASQAETKLWEDKYNAYKAAYETVSKKGGVGCFFVHLFTLWLVPCR